jgi:hypothetical protein
MFKSLFTTLLCLGFFSTQAITYTTIADGDWNLASTWDASGIPSLGNFSNHVVVINHDVTRTGNLSVITSSFTIADGVTFTIDGNFIDTFNGGSYNSGATSVWNITGNLDISSDATFQTGNGTVNVGGNYDVEGHNVTTIVDGVLNVAGTIMKGAGSSKIIGSGIVTWGVLEIGGTNKIGDSPECPNAGFDLSDSGVNLSDCSEALPVELLSFTSDCSAEGVLIEWITATETNNHFFEIQKGLGSFDFVTIAEIEGQGTTSYEYSYSYVDRGGEASTTYYRLRQVDFDGEYEYSNIIASQCDVLESEFSIYPTVSSGQYTLTFNQENRFIKIQLINKLGEVVKVINYTNNDTSSELMFDLDGFSSGVYFATVQMGNQFEVSKLIKR